MCGLKIILVALKALYTVTTYKTSIKQQKPLNIIYYQQFRFWKPWAKTKIIKYKKLLTYSLRLYLYYVYYLSIYFMLFIVFMLLYNF